MLNTIQTFFRKIRHKAILKRIKFEHGDKVLDTSCQDGTFLEVLLEQNPTACVSGVDINRADIMEAENRIPNGVFKLADNKNLPFRDASFDVIISAMTLHHMYDPESSLHEMKRVLKEGGSIYIIDLITKNTFLNKILKHRKCPEPYHFEKWYTLEEMKTLSQKCGLSITRIESAIIFPAISVVLPVLILRLNIEKK